MVKFKINPARFAEACNLIEYLGASNRSREIIIRIAPRFIVDNDDNYIVKVNLDVDSDIEGFENFPEAFEQMAKVTPKRLEKLVNEFMEAAKAIVDPPSGRG